jgi:hypothetical protein
MQGMLKQKCKKEHDIKEVIAQKIMTYRVHALRGAAKLLIHSSYAAPFYCVLIPST